MQPAAPASQGTPVPPARSAPELPAPAVGMESAKRPFLAASSVNVRLERALQGRIVRLAPAGTSVLWEVAFLKALPVLRGAEPMGSAQRPIPAPATPAGQVWVVTPATRAILVHPAPRAPGGQATPAAATEFAAKGSWAWEIATAWGIGPATTARSAPMAMTQRVDVAPRRESNAVLPAGTTASARIPTRAPVTWDGPAPSATPAHRAILVHPAPRAPGEQATPVMVKGPVTATESVIARPSGMALIVAKRAAAVSDSTMERAWTSMNV